MDYLVLMKWFLKLSLGQWRKHTKLCEILAWLL
jgi:hypothetical protein